MATIQTTKMSVTAGLQLATQMVKMTYISKRSGQTNQLMSLYMLGEKRMPRKHIPTVNDTIHAIGEELMQVRITPDDTLSQLKELGKVVKLPYIFQGEMGWTTGKMKMHLSSKVEKLYGQFTTEMLIQINTALLKIAMQMMQIEIDGDVQEPTS